MTPYGSTTMGSLDRAAADDDDPVADVRRDRRPAGAGQPDRRGRPVRGRRRARRIDAGSDRHLKTDITKIGVHPPTGLPLYRYRYKGDPKSYPKVSGPMAEDAMQVAPHAVQTVGVHGPTGQALHSVDMNALDQAGPPMGANDNMAGRACDPAAPHAGRERRVPDAGAGAARAAAPMGPIGAHGRQHAGAAHAAQGRDAEGSGGAQWLTVNSGFDPTVFGDRLQERIAAGVQQPAGQVDPATIDTLANAPTGAGRTARNRHGSRASFRDRCGRPVRLLRRRRAPRDASDRLATNMLAGDGLIGRD